MDNKFTQIYIPDLKVKKKRIVVLPKFLPRQ